MPGGPLPDGLAKIFARKLAEDQLVLFVGAGVSHQARAPTDPNLRIPLWRDLAQKVAADHEETIDEYSGGILELFDAISQSYGRSSLEDSVRRAINDAAFEPSPAHRTIARLPWHLVYTTNYDSLLSRAMDVREPIVTEQDHEMLRRAPDARPRLVHLHGDLKQMHTLTGEDYNLWEIDHPVATNKLKDTLFAKTFLFIGYSYSDPHLRRGIFPWIRRIGKDRLGRNYAWMWNVSKKQVMVLDRSTKIEVTPFTLSEEWEQALQQIEIQFAALRTGAGSIAPARILSQPSSTTTTDGVHLNGYKLFYYRTTERLSVKELSRRSSVSPRRIKHLERVSKSKPTGGSCFAVATRDEVEALESALRRRGVLQCGLEDDFLAAYVGHYKDHRRGSANSVVEPTTTRAVVFDFGGTLTVPSPPYNTWERLWLSVGYEVSEVTSLHLLFRQGRISHQEWCDSTCDKLRSRGFSRKHLDSVASKITPVAGVFETFETLTNRGIPIYILSGSIRQIIRTTLGLPAYSLVSEVKCNEILFDDNGLISEINGHDFDFEGKAQFIKRIIQERRCAPIEVLFVGNSFNDQYAARSGARTLCVNPSHTDFSDRLIWSEPCIKELRNLSQILAHV